MKNQVFELANTVCWDRNDGDKVYLDQATITVRELPFATRQVFLRFAGGPELDLSIIDMDRLAIEYLKMRGVKVPPEACQLANAEPPPRCDFVVPKSLMAQVRSANDPPLRGESVEERCCARCGQTCADSGDWFGDLCPECADATERD